MSDRNHIYYDLLNTNIENSDSEPILCSFTEQRNQNFLENPEDYKLSITRFMIETPAIPLFRPTIQSIPIEEVPIDIEPGDYTIYSISLQLSNAEAFNGTYQPTQVSQQYIVWEPQTLNKKTPSSPYFNTNGLQDNSTGYYNCMSYAWFLGLIKKAFDKALEELGLNNIYTSPSIYFDSASSLFVLSAPQNGYDTNSTEDYYLEIYMNKPLYQLFSSLPATNNSSLKDYGLNFQIITNNYNGFSVTVINDADHFMVYSEYPTTYLWSPVSSIVFTSSNLPVSPSNVSNPIVTRDGTNLLLSGQSNTRMIITDLVAGDNYKPYLVYTPSAEYRFMDLKGGVPIKDIDIQVYYQDRQGNLNELKLSSGSSCSIKLLFQRKVLL